MKRPSQSTCGKTSRFSAHRSILGQALAILALVGIAISLQPATASAQDWRPTEAQQIKLQELAAAYDQWLQDHRTPLYYDIIEGRDPRSVLLEDRSVTLAYISDRGVPIWDETNNVIAAETISTDEVQPGGSSGYNLTGAGTTGAQLGIWEGGADSGVLTTHESLTGRVNQVDATNLSNHATHVAGTMISSGVDADALGMSYQANLDAYTSGGDSGEMATAAAAGMMISNHSYGARSGWRGLGGWWGDTAIDQDEDWKFGFYDARAQQWDQVAYDAPNYLIFKSAGNDRNDFAPPAGTEHVHADGLDYTDTHDDDGGPNGYDCIPMYGNAKNIVTVGAVNDIPGGYTGPGDVVQSTFSGWGPADDGRIKPDIVANGVDLYSTGANDDDHYYFSPGTSMSCPSVSGSANLLRGQFQTLNGAPPRSATLKALIINTADEAGPADGPDYMNGWGLMNTLRAADFIAAEPFADSGIVEDDLADGGSDSYTLFVNNAGDARVTIVWTDPAGTPTADSLDPPDLMLVNDLDLRLRHVDSNVTFRPWILNPANPAANATTGDNTRDNVEQVDIASAPLGEYEIVVNHKGNLVGSPQQYSLVYAGMSTNAAPVAVCQNVQVDADADCLGFVTPDMVDDGSFDPDGDPITLALEPAGPYALGATNVTLTVTDDKGASDSCDAVVTVVDVTPPVVVCPADIEVECSVAGGVPFDDPQLVDFFDAFMATDNCDDNLDIMNDAPALFAGPCDVSNGVTVVTWTATDDAGNASMCSATVTVVDTTPPEIMVTVEPEVLWPPNHKMVEVEYTVTVSDICDDDPQWVLVSVVSDEPDNGRGDGNTVDDIQDADLGTPDNFVSLRSERSGAEDGRVYTATFEVTDCSGNTAEATSNVYVPHSASDFVTILSSGGLPGSESGSAFMISGASLWGEDVPVEINGNDGVGGEMNFVDPVSAFITNTAGFVRPNAFYLKDVDSDGHADVLIGFDPDALAELAAISTPEDGDPAMVLEIGIESFIVLELTRAEESDLDLPRIIDDLRGQGSVSEPLVQNDTGAPRVAGLIGAAPNPFNPATKISYYIPDTRHVELAIFDISGRRISRLVSQTMEAGEHSVMWHGTDTRGSRVASGVYFYQLTAGTVVETKRMIMVK